MSFAEAVKWWRKAADQNYALAQHNLGNSYRSGKGVEQDYAEAVTWFRKAARQGFAPAQNDLGVCYAKGLGVTEDDIEAYKWLLLAAAQGDQLARNFMAKVEGRMGREQIAQGQKLAGDFKPLKVSLPAAPQGASGGNPGADLLAQAGSGDFKPPGPPFSDAPPGEAGDQPLADLRAKAATGDAKAQNELGEALRSGKRGVTRNAVVAVQWFRQAAEQNLAAAQSNLGECYERGDGVAKYEVEGYKWDLLAAAQGNVKAKRNVFTLELIMSPEQKAEGKRRADVWLEERKTTPLKTR
jgi:hypothetical protein